MTLQTVGRDQKNQEDQRLAQYQVDVANRLGKAVFEAAYSSDYAPWPSDCSFGNFSSNFWADWFWLCRRTPYPDPDVPDDNFACSELAVSTDKLFDRRFSDETLNEGEDGRIFYTRSTGNISGW